MIVHIASTFSRDELGHVCSAIGGEEMFRSGTHIGIEGRFSSYEESESIFVHWHTQSHVAWQHGHKQV